MSELGDPKTLAVYAAQSKEFVTRFCSIDRTIVRDRVAEIFLPEERMLELGCGSGADAAALIDAGYNLTASDGSPEMLAKARDKFPQIVERSCIAVLPGPLPFENESFSGVFAIAVLQHLPTDALVKTLVEIRRVLKNEGRLLTWIFSKRSDLDRDSRDPDGRLMTLLPPEVFEPMLRAANLRIDSSSVVPDLFDRVGFETREYVCSR